MNKQTLHYAQERIYEILHTYQEQGGDFLAIKGAILELAAKLPECRMRRWLADWHASEGMSEGDRYDQLATYWAGLWAADEN